MSVDAADLDGQLDVMVMATSFLRGPDATDGEVIAAMTATFVGEGRDDPEWMGGLLAVALLRLSKADDHAI